MIFLFKNEGQSKKENFPKEVFDFQYIVFLVLIFSDEKLLKITAYNH